MMKNRSIGAKNLALFLQTKKLSMVFLNVADILEFADTVDLARVQDLLEAQLSCNLAIAQEGLAHPWGAQVGAILLAETPDPDAKTEAKAWAAASSRAARAS